MCRRILALVGMVHVGTGARWGLGCLPKAGRGHFRCVCVCVSVIRCLVKMGRVKELCMAWRFSGLAACVACANVER
jgi:hypothetical protein